MHQLIVHQLADEGMDIRSMDTSGGRPVAWWGADLGRETIVGPWGVVGEGSMSLADQMKANEFAEATRALAPVNLVAYGGFPLGFSQPEG